MLKELFDKGKCALGFQSGDWRYVQDQQCEQIQVCSRCQTQSRQVVHNWAAWQYSETFLELIGLEILAAVALLLGWQRNRVWGTLELDVGVTA